MENNQNEIDVRKVVRVVLEHWWWFAIGVAFFLLLGVAYYVRKSPSWTTDASIMLRQGDMMSEKMDPMAMLGLGGNAQTEDELVVFSSRGLIAQSIDALNLWEYSFVKDGVRWKGEFRNPALTIDYIRLTEDASLSPFTVTVKATKSGYKVKTKLGYFTRSTSRVETQDEPIETAVGTIRSWWYPTTVSCSRWRSIRKSRTSSIFP